MQQQPADNKKIARKLPVPATEGGRREVTREQIEAAADYFDVWSDDDDDDLDDCYTDDDDGCHVEIYITAAFRCSFGNQAYVFMDHEYMLLNYDPRMLDGGLLDGPKLIGEGIPSLYGTVFGNCGIYCSFGLHHRNEAFIFTGNNCARIAYAPGISDFKILEGPKTITRMFPFLKGTAFEDSVDAAFESTTDNEAYLFRGHEYVIINYEDGCLISDKQIFECLNDTVFVNGFDAAFTSHVPGEAFIFKKDFYALINFVDKCIIGDVRNIHDCPSIGSVLPRDSFLMDEDEFVVYSIDEPCDEYVADLM